jgi:hypothetical protein
MKKIFILSSVVLLSFSCKKTSQCECKQYFPGQVDPIVTNVAIEKETEKNAKVKCKSLGNNLGNGIYTECTLK